MKIEITGRPVYWIEFTNEQIQELMKLSANHYDGLCVSACKPGGFLYGWQNGVLWSNGDATEPYKCKATHHELDILLKIMEMHTSDPEIRELFTEVLRAMEQAEELFKNFSVLA